MAYSYSNSGGESDYGSIFNRVFSGGGGGSNGGGSVRAGGGGRGSSIMNNILSSANSSIPVGGWGALGPTAFQASTRTHLMREQMPYIMQQETAAMNNASSERIAEMNAKAQLAAELLERNNELEIQRRNQLGDDYGTKQQYYYQYGI